VFHLYFSRKYASYYDRYVDNGKCNFNCIIGIVIIIRCQIISGPTAIMAIMTLSYSEGKPPEYAVLLCFMTGLVTLLMGILQLGKQ